MTDTVSTILVCIVIATLYLFAQAMYALWKADQEGYMSDAEFKNQVEDTIADMKTMQAVKSASDNIVTRYEHVRKDDKMYIQRKEYYICSYCGSKSEITNINCTQCGAPTRN